MRLHDRLQPCWPTRKGMINIYYKEEEEDRLLRWRRRSKIFLAGVNFFRFNAKNWRFYRFNAKNWRFYRFKAKNWRFFYRFNAKNWRSSV